MRYVVISQNHGDHTGGTPLFAPPAALRSRATGAEAQVFLFGGAEEADTVTQRTNMRVGATGLLSREAAALSHFLRESLDPPGQPPEQA